MEGFCSISGCSSKSAISFHGKIYKIENIVKSFKELKVNFGDFIYRSLAKKGKDIRPSEKEDADTGKRTIAFEDFFEEGIPFEILEPGSEEWVKGRMRIKMSLEFVVDQPDPLDSETQSDKVKSASANSLDAIREVSNTLTD
jgi:hypothetical protein